MLLNTAKLITNIKNATRINLLFTFVPYTTTNLLILNHFLNHKLIKGYQIFENKYKIKVFIESNSIKYIEGLKLHSKPSLRKYTKFNTLVKLNHGCYFGMISTTSGILPFNDAILKRKGGEIIFLINYI
jgi:ribosomal protein S8